MTTAGHTDVQAGCGGYADHVKALVGDHAAADHGEVETSELGLAPN